MRGLDDQVVALVRGQVGGIILGSMFLLVGLAACGVASVRRRSEVGVLAWFGIFSGMYGLRLLASSSTVFSLLPRFMWEWAPYVVAILTYLILIPALMFWLELSLGTIRRFIWGLLLVAIAVAVAGVFVALTTRNPFRLMAYNNVLAIVFIGALAVVNVVPSLARRFLVIPSRATVVTSVVLASAVLHANLRTFFTLPAYPFLEPLAFGAFVLSLGYVTAEKVFGDERRLLSIEKELAIAREIQSSILPNGVPKDREAADECVLPSDDRGGGGLL